jgi:thioredoxin 1
MQMGKPVVLDFFADWCGPCRRQGPYLEELKKNMGEKIEIRKIDVDQNMDLANKYGIRVVPTLIIEKDGKVVRTLEGVTSADSLESMLLPLVE